MKIFNIDALMEHDGWTGIVARCVTALIIYGAAFWTPRIFTWVAEVVFKRHVIIDERRHEMVMYLADFFLAFMILSSVILAIRLLRSRKK